MLSQLEPAYAMTVHKSQGSEYRAVVLCAWRGTPLLLSRSVLYTAVTRARGLVYCLGHRDTVARMVRTVQSRRRYTSLSVRLQEV